MRLRNTANGVEIDLPGDWVEVKASAWADVTGECVIHGSTGSLYRASYCLFSAQDDSYRLRKIPVRFGESPNVFHEYAFIVELKQ